MFFQRTRVHFLELHLGSRLSVAQVPQDLTPSSDLLEHQALEWFTDTHACKTPIYIQFNVTEYLKVVNTTSPESRKGEIDITFLEKTCIECVANFNSLKINTEKESLLVECVESFGLSNQIPIPPLGGRAVGMKGGF